MHLRLRSLAVFFTLRQRFFQMRVHLHCHLVEELRQGEGHAGEAGHVTCVVGVEVVEFMVDAEAVHLELLFKSWYDQVLQHRLRYFQHTTPIRISTLRDEHDRTLNILTVIQLFQVFEKTSQLIFFVLSGDNLRKLEATGVS